MTPSAEAQVWLAIVEHIDKLVPTYPLAMPAQAFTPPNDGNGALLPFLRVGRVVAEPLAFTVTPRSEAVRTGAVILTLVCPLGQHVSVYDDAAGQIAAHFGQGAEMRHNGVCVAVMGCPHVGAGYDDGGYWSVPIRVNWRCVL